MSPYKDNLPPRWLQPLEPPECPPGWRTGPPDFVGIGAQRSGTTWWFRALSQHPQVATVDKQIKELHFFDRYWQSGSTPTMCEVYRQFFPRPEGLIAGEFTPRYMHDYWSLRLLAECAPNARLLVLLRDPVKRYLSGVARYQRRFQRPIDLMLLADAAARGFYHHQLKAVFQRFPREQVLVLQYERCAQDQRGQMDATCAFLGIEPFAELPDRAVERKRPPNAHPELDADMRADLVRRLEDDVRQLPALCPEIDLELWPNFQHLAGAVPPGEVEVPAR